jgi:hypothetical protein
MTHEIGRCLVADPASLDREQLEHSGNAARAEVAELVEEEDAQQGTTLRALPDLASCPSTTGPSFMPLATRKTAPHVVDLLKPPAKSTSSAREA